MPMFSYEEYMSQFSYTFYVVCENALWLVLQMIAEY